LSENDTVTITQPGTYLIGSVIRMDSGKSLIGGEGVAIKRLGAFANMVANRNPIAASRDTNITIQDIVFDSSSNDTYSGKVIPTAHGILYFRNVDGLTLDNVSVINGGPNLFGIHVEEAEDAAVTDYLYDGDKDGFHVTNGCDGVLLDGFDISSKDDALAIIGHDYPAVQGSAQDITNITIRNGVSRVRTGQLGFFLRLITGSWINWANGAVFNIGHICVNAGNLYKKVNAGDIEAANAPVHTSGDVTARLPGGVWAGGAAGDRRSDEIDTRRDIEHFADHQRLPH
jgi:hypothetical protein